MRNYEHIVKTRIEPTTVITVRLPASIHYALKAEAEAAGISLNNLCIQKLVAPLNPTEDSIRDDTFSSRSAATQGR